CPCGMPEGMPCYPSHVRHELPDQRSASDRPFCFQLDAPDAAGPEPAPPPFPFFPTGEAGSSTANIPAAIAAIVVSSTASGFDPVALDRTDWLAFASRRSRYPVSSFPA